MKLSFRQRLFLYFTILFTVFTVGIAWFELTRETNFRTEALEEKLDIYAHIIHHSFSEESSERWNTPKNANPALPSDLRITLIDLHGKVVFDNTIESFSELENHAERAEISKAKINGSGSDIRHSESNQLPYLYHAKQFDQQFVRVALPYDLKLKRFLKADNIFLYFLLSLFLISLFFIHRITQQFGNSIKRLRDFALQTNTQNLSFGNDELGEIGNQILENYRQQERHKQTLSLEKQKLLQHIQISEEGICFVSDTQAVELYNGLFIQYLNQLVAASQSNPEIIFSDDLFIGLQRFLHQDAVHYYEEKIEKHGKTFWLRTTRFNDNSFEIILTDVTQRETTKKLKKELTGNIAHELRTPLTSIRAYLETILEQPLDADKKAHFIKQAYRQTLQLSEMIQDMSLIAKIEEAPSRFTRDPIKLHQLIESIKEQQTPALSQQNVAIKNDIAPETIFYGNESLLTSLFRNLIENSLRYGGTEIEIGIKLLNEDNNYFHFLFYDTGTGIENEAQLHRIFERFYRIQEGRTRTSGGSGLGLSIVKNAVQFHHGTIVARNRKNGGLEFLFSLKKQTPVD